MAKYNPNTIEAIENVYWGEPNYISSLVTRCHALRKKDLDLFEIEDYRILIGQNIALEIIMPGAMVILRQNLFAEGDYYQGDLLKVVLTSDQSYWNKHPDMKQEIISLFDQYKSAMNDLFAGKEILLAFDAFTK